MHEGTRLIIVVVQLGAMKIYAQQQLRRSGKRKDRMKLSLPPKLMDFWVWIPPLNVVNVLFCRFFFESHPVYIQTQGSGAVFFLTLRITLILHEIGKIDSRLMPNYVLSFFVQTKANLLGDHARAVTLTMAFLADNSEVRYRSCIADALVHELE